MDNLKKAVYIVIFVFAFIFASIYAFLVFSGKSILTKTLANLTQKKVTVGSLTLTPPINLTISKLNIEGLAKVDSISISPSILYLLTGKVALNSISVVNPHITYEIIKPQDNKIPGTAINKPVTTQTNAPIPGHLIIKRLNIKNGEVDLFDHAVSPEGVKIIVKEINFNLTNLYLFPISAITSFDLSGKMPWKENKTEGSISAKGWINLFKKDVQITLKVQDIDGVYLHPYYSTWVDLEKARIESANLNFTSNIQGVDNDVTADCHLELASIVRKPRPPEEPQQKAERLTDAVLDIFKSLNNGNIVLDFTIKTKMDNPQFGFGNIKSAFESKLFGARGGMGIRPQDVAMLPIKIIQGTVKGATDISKAVIDGTFAVGNEIMKALESSFRRESIPKKSSEDSEKK